MFVTAKGYNKTLKTAIRDKKTHDVYIHLIVLERNSKCAMKKWRTKGASGAQNAVFHPRGKLWMYPF